MSEKPKRSRNEEDDSENEEEEQNDDDESDVEIAYDFNSMSPQYMNQVMKILDYYLPGGPNPDAIESIGKSCLESDLTTVLVVPDDSDETSNDVDIHGVITILTWKEPLSQGLEAVKKLIINSDSSGYFQKELTQPDVGYILFESSTSIQQICTQLFVNLFDEYNQSKKKKYTNYLVLARIYEAKAEVESDDKPKKKKSKKEDKIITIKPTAENLTDVQFTNPVLYKCWKHRKSTTPFIVIPNPSNRPQDESAPYIPEATIPFILESKSIPSLLKDVKSLDAYYADVIDML
eukprot:NODE_5250_length_1042_cov_33.096844_g4689_i0.p1 GENE.NODE_5250_length_1042_cov_33.096844_g4689_i0~~NODE_5250_length_1042_cov_33.096844_g4689_i0.p1  ORF type:complete len:291 (+),score=63.94 NODE_5250_length_1042_cov_33.096844_g4689_i0:46-918(+)